jgi:hypothetical protein
MDITKEKIALKAFVWELKKAEKLDFAGHIKYTTMIDKCKDVYRLKEIGYELIDELCR